MSRKSKENWKAQQKIVFIFFIIACLSFGIGFKNIAAQETSLDKKEGKVIALGESFSFKKENDVFRFKTPSIKGWDTNLHLYWDLQYTSMGDMPMEMTDDMGMPMIGTMKRQNYLDQRHTNLLLDANKENLHFRANLETLSLFNAGSQEYALVDKNVVRMLEYYGEYAQSDILKIRTGKFLAPFGIYNDIRFLTPLYSTVVLPVIYELPVNYKQESFYPPDANFMFHGQLKPINDTKLEYRFYLGTGKRDQDSIQLGSDLSIGFRARINYKEQYKFGLSTYTVNINPATDGREVVNGIDLLLGPFKGATFQTEFVKGLRELRKDRQAFNARLTYELGYLNPSLEKFTPYLMFDRLYDKEDLLFKKKGDRYGIGLAIKFTTNFSLRNEFHYHNFADPTEGDMEIPKNARNTKMWRTTFNVVF